MASTIPPNPTNTPHPNKWHLQQDLGFHQHPIFPPLNISTYYKTKDKRKQIKA